MKTLSKIFFILTSPLLFASCIFWQATSDRLLSSLVINSSDDVETIGISGDYLYFPCGRYGLSIIDISDPTSLTEIGANYPLDQEIGNVAVSGSFLFAWNRQKYSPKNIHVLDISNPASPSLVHKARTVLDYSHRVISGDYWYELGIDPSSPDDMTLDIYQVSEIVSSTTPVRYGRGTVPGQGSRIRKLEDELREGERISVQGDHLYFISDFSFMVFDVSDKTTPILTAEKPYDLTQFAVAVKDPCAYVLYGLNDDQEDNKLQLLDITDKTSPPLENGIIESIGGIGRSPVVSGDYLFLRKEGAIIVHDSSDPFNPQVVDRLSVRINWGKLFPFGDYMFVVSQYDELLGVVLVSPYR